MTLPKPDAASLAGLGEGERPHIALKYYLDSLPAERAAELEEMLGQVFGVVAPSASVMECGCLDSEHPPRHNYLAGAAERDGRVCRLGWSLHG